MDLDMFAGEDIWVLVGIVVFVIGLLLTVSVVGVRFGASRKKKPKKGPGLAVLDNLEAMAESDQEYSEFLKSIGVEVDAPSGSDTATVDDDAGTHEPEPEQEGEEEEYGGLPQPDKVADPAFELMSPSGASEGAEATAGDGAKPAPQKKQKRKGLFSFGKGKDDTGDDVDDVEGDGGGALARDGGGDTLKVRSLIGEALTVDEFYEEVDGHFHEPRPAAGAAWVVTNPQQALSDPPTALKWVDGEMKRVRKLLDGMLKQVEQDEDNPPEYGQHDISSAVHRLDFVVDGIRRQENRIVGKQRKTWYQVEERMDALLGDLNQLLQEAQGDTIQVSPFAWPQGFASHIPASGIVDLSSANTPVYRLLDIVPPTVVALAPRTVASAPSLVSVEAEDLAAQGDEVLLGDVDDDRVVDDKKKKRRDLKQFKAFGLPEPLPERGRRRNAA